MSQNGNRPNQAHPTKTAKQFLSGELGRWVNKVKIMSLFGRLFGTKKKDDNAIENICKVVDAFMIASLLLIDTDELKSKPEKHRKVMAYHFGAIDYLGQASNLDEMETLAATVIFLMKHYQMGPDEAGDTARLMMELSRQPEGIAYMMEGGNAMKRWHEGDKNAPLRLFELLQGG